MQERFDRILKGLLPDGEAVLLAVSGGIDSMCMADLFLNSAVKRRLALAHCNFHLRGEESDSDEALVREWAEEHGIIFIKKDFDTLGYAASNGVSIEMAARELRYRWFAEVCREQGFSALAVAHNANDNAETMILNMLRGTGVKGMTGMRRSSPLPGSDALLIRPLLDFPRKDIHKYAVSYGLQWHEDRTNTDSTYKRNCIRNEVFPLFERLNPSFLTTLNEDMERFAQVQSVAGEYVAVTSAWEIVISPVAVPVVRQVSPIVETTDVIVNESGIYSLNGVKFSVSLSDDVKNVRTALGETKFDTAKIPFPFTVRHWKNGDWMRPLGMKGRRKLSDIFVDLKFGLPEKEKALVIADEGSHILALIGHRIDDSVKVTKDSTSVTVVRFI